jgi:hypothetical protein
MALWYAAWEWTIEGAEFGKFSEPAHNDQQELSDKVMSLYTWTVSIFISIVMRILDHTYSVLSSLLIFYYF